MITLTLEDELASPSDNREFMLIHEHAFYRHAAAGKPTTSREARLVDAPKKADYIRRSRCGLERDEYGEYVQIGRSIDAHVRGGANAPIEYYVKIYLIEMTALCPTCRLLSI